MLSIVFISVNFAPVIMMYIILHSHAEMYGRNRGRLLYLSMLVLDIPRSSVCCFRCIVMGRKLIVLGFLRYGVFDR
jgi:hypothetical protein